MTPVQQAGFKVGDKFIVNIASDGFAKGAIITLDRDDGTNYPMFSGPNSLYNLASGSQSGAYMRLGCISKLVEAPKFKIGDTVKIVSAGNGFESQYRGRTGTIEQIDGTHLPVQVVFEDGGSDWGQFEELELVEEINAITVREKLEAIKKLVKEVQELVG